jgi:hypothetical protein
VNNSILSEGLSSRKRKEAGSNSLKINMSTIFLKKGKIPKTMAAALEKKFPDFVSKNKLTNSQSNINFGEYQNKVKIRNMRERVEKLINK